MVKGRRAADRRRQRLADAGEAFADDDPVAETNVNFTPDYSVVAAPPAQEHVELSASLSARSQTDLDRTHVLRLSLKERNGGRLTVLTGPDAGQRSLLRTSPSRLGRFGECEFPLSDDKVSRVHALLEFDPDEEMWILQDQESTSGTLVRGECIVGEIRLRHGDLIEVGESVLRFTWSEQLPEIVEVEHTRTEDIRAARVVVAKEEAKVELKKKSSKVWGTGQTQIVLALVAAVLFFAMAGSAAWAILHFTSTDSAQLDAQTKVLAEDIRGFLRELNLPEARSRIETALAIAPNNPTILSLLRILESEEAAQKALKDAQAAIDHADIDAARTFLQTIPDSSGFSAARDGLANKMSDVVRMQTLAKITALLEAGDIEKARTLLAAHLKKYPRDQAAQALLDRLDRLKATASAKTAAYRSAVRAFANGDRQKARALMSGDAHRKGHGAERWLLDLDRFERALLQGQLSLRRKNGSKAAKLLGTAWTLTKRLSGSTANATGRQVASPYSDALYLRGLSKLSAGNGCEAARLFRQARSVSSSNRKVSAKVRQMEQRAREAMLRAQGMRATQSARARAVAREHLCYVSPSSSLYKKLSRLAK